MMLSGIEKKALKQGIKQCLDQGIAIGREERAKEVYQNLLKLGVSKEILNQAVYNNQPPNDSSVVD